MKRCSNSLSPRIWGATCALSLLFAVSQMTLSAQTFKTLVNFNGKNGYQPHAPLVQGANGSYYGTTAIGGYGNGGNVFQINPQGLSAYSFCESGTQCSGEDPMAGLIQCANGGFYGTTSSGGNDSDGTVFRMTPTGIFTLVHSFYLGTDGALPGELVEAADGDLYGATGEGGTGPHGSGGTVFKITPGGTLTVLYDFCSKSNCADGSSPTGGLIQASDGNFYGTTSQGGAIATCEFPNGCGTVFRITPGGDLKTIYAFCLQSGCADGAGPVGGLVQGPDGDLYGATADGGLTSYGGTIFKITLDGMLTTLYNFCSQSQCPDGSLPEAGLIHATDGNLYGTTSSGGLGNGTIFRITPTGNLRTLHSFALDEGHPLAPLIQATNGAFYGTTWDGGLADDGTVFSLSMGLAPFVETQTKSGAVGAAVNILGNNLTGASSVTFNGTPAVFAVPASSVITTAVPTGATTGKIEVVTPGGTLTSNASFIVLP